MELYIIRHGETVWNEAGRLQGRADIELNSNGRSIAGRLGEQLENIDFDCIYSSPLIRAYETACLIRGHRNIPIVRDERLQEISFGCMEGTHYSEWLADNSPYRFFFDEPAKYNPPTDGESFKQVCMRTENFIHEIIEPQVNSAKRLMIVAHGALNKGIMCYIEKNSIANYWGNGLQKNCEAAIFNYDGISWKR